MKFISFHALRVPSLVLAALLQVLPVVRVALPAAESAANVIAIIFRWTAAAAAALGGVQAVSGASTTITSPLNVSATQGRPFYLRLTTAPDQAHYWSASGLPTGLSVVGTNGQTLWSIQGTPTVSGIYNVALTAKDQANSGPSLSVSATLVMNVAAGSSPPAIATQPTSQTATQGQTVTFSVVATGTGPLRYQWRFQQTVLAGRTNADLVLTAVSSANAGTYDVVVANSYGSVTSSVAALTITVPMVAPTITAQPVALTITQGQSATFRVSAGGTTPFTCFWRKDAVVIAVSPALSWTITNAQVADAGAYSIIVSNSAGTATSSSALLTVNPAPQAPFISRSPTNVAAIAGSTVSFSLTAGGSTPLQYQWYFNNAALAGRTAPSCALTNVQSANAGAYLVVVTNAFGSVTSSVATLTILAPPVFAPMTVRVRGAGAVAPNYNGQALEIGKSYTMTALPAADNLFVNWTGGITSNTAALTFVMRSNLVVQANFKSNVVAFVDGTYNGLFCESAGVFHYSSGALTLTTTRLGAYSAKLALAGRRYAFSGRFSVPGRATNTITRGALNPVGVELELSATNIDQLRGWITGGSWTSELLGDRAGFNPAFNPAPQAGSYTWVIPGMPGATASPAGDGFAAITVNTAGRLTLKGRLADGTRIAQGATIGSRGAWPLYVALYSGSGSLLSWQEFADQPGDDLSGRLSWIRSQQPSVAYYPMGFAVETDAIGSRYVPPRTAAEALSFSGGQFQLSGGNLANDLSSPIQPAANGISGNYGLTLALALKTGLFQGRFADPATGNTIPFSGALLPKRNSGSGFFLGATASGRVYVGP